MIAPIHPLWDSPPPDAPEIQKQAHRLMMQTLKVIRPRCPDVLPDPGNAGGKRVMDAAMAAMLNPKIDPQLRLAALAMLQQRMASVDPTMPKRLFLGRAKHESAIAPSFGRDLHALAEFDQALENYLLQQRPGMRLRDPQPVTTADAHAAIGILVALLVTRLGHGSVALIGKAVEAIERKPWVAGCWAWIDLNVSADPSGTAEIRRLFLDPTTFASWLLAADGVSQLPKPHESLKAGKRAAFHRSRARHAFRALIEAMRASGQHATITTLDRLCHCQVQRLRMVTIPLLATYAQGDVASSSLEIGTWLRLIGHLAPEVAPDDSDQSTPAMAHSADSVAHRAPPLTGIDPGDEGRLQEQIAAGDLAEDGIIEQLRSLMSKKRTSWREGFDAIIEELEAAGPSHETARWIVGWLRHLAVERKNKGKALSDGSVRHYRGLLVNRLLQILPAQLGEVDDEQLLDAYLEVIMSRRSLEQTAKIKAALVSFDQYLRQTHLPFLPRVALPGFEGASYAISSRILVEEEFLRGLDLTRDGSVAFNDETLARQARAFWTLAFRFGLRRTEILGLQQRDVGEELLRIRRNEGRSLKTPNAHRVVPLSALNAAERGLLHTLGKNRDAQDYLFFNSGVPTPKDLEAHPVIAKINDLLERVSGDRRMHPHNLRHSAATLISFGTLGRDLNIASHPYATSWMKVSLRTAPAVEGAISGHLHRKGGRGSALAVLLGHGSELTTYEHYVHCFDLLLFLSCWSGRFDPVKRNVTRRLSPPRQETSQLLAMLGYASTTRIETSDMPALLRRIGSLRPEHVIVLQPIANGPLTTAGSDGAERYRIPITHQQLLEISGAREMRGYPTTQADLDTVSFLLSTLNKARANAVDQLDTLIKCWLDHQRSNDDWASMSPDAARDWVDGVTRLLPAVSIEAIHVSKKHASGKILKTAVAQPGKAGSYCAGSGRYWVRFTDGRKKVNRRKSASGKQRSRSQASISWLLATGFLGVQADAQVDVRVRDPLDRDDAIREHATETVTRALRALQLWMDS